MQRAISNLSDPRLNRDYASKIMQAIDLENKPQLIVKYVRCAQPLLTEPDDIDDDAPLLSALRINIIGNLVTNVPPTEVFTALRNLTLHL